MMCNVVLINKTISKITLNIFYFILITYEIIII